MKRLTLIITTVFSLLFILYSFLFAYNANEVVQVTVQQETQESMRDTVHSVERITKNLTAEDVVNNSSAWFDAQQEIMNTLNPMERVSIYDANHKEVLSFGNKLLANIPFTEAGKQALDKNLSFTEFENEEDMTTYEYTGLIKNKNHQPIASIRVLRNVNDITEAQNRLLIVSVGGSVVMVLILLAILSYYFKKIAQPIYSISDVVGRLSKSDYSIRYNQLGVAEIDELGDDINDLASNLSRQDIQISMQEERLQLLMDYLVVGVLMIDKKHRIKVANKAAYSIFDLDDNVINHKYEEVLTGYRLLQMIETCYSTKENVNDEVYLYYPKELILDVNILYVPKKANVSGISEQVVVLAYDITEIRRLEKVRSDFIANASHELKTPVTALKGFTETLLDGALEDEDTAREFVEIMNREANRLGFLINDILDLAKIEQDQLGHRSETVQLNRVIAEVVHSLEIPASENRVKVHYDNDLEAGIRFTTEEMRLKQILTNLINNAIKYNKAEGGQVWISSTVTEDDKYVVIAIRDNGLGIPDEDIPRIFERFYRVDKTRSTASGGTGLGLSIVRNLVASMSGKIDVVSELNEGSTFTVYLPKNDKNLLETEADTSLSADSE
ncbi:MULTISPECIES: two-component system histidine kinase PnpS [Aerococcus]|uniref:two-component system histidine kinase PnpS n=1 Tax=Aerococcus TaxID=1375 RepID=UPI000DCE9997|nr:MULTISPECIES: ATP-binding protein [Aerococcus]MDK6688579.1 ATP-binding protein [Aerococcus urinae]MDK8133073.1 ATP-binding protein [Aerococcus urinae]MDK8484764.1 ATP-binding protein [Aerococcus urinae]MDL5177917.1 ATP-binding protein [Aerococcus tenax]RAV92213.1 sensor histidine kinase [Aerococcus tenax]